LHQVREIVKIRHADAHRLHAIYRNSVVGAGMRLHVATFDAGDEAAYNRENCQIAADLFKSQPNVGVRYWCEKGRFMD
jgi:hypothetical protein